MLNIGPRPSIQPTLGSTATVAGLWYSRALRSPEILARFARSVALLLEQEDFLLCSYLSDGPVGRNWGDKLNPVLVSMISGRRVLNAHSFYNVLNIPVYAVIGSGLASPRHSNSIIWGQGFARYDERLRARPRQICAVRGPLSRQRILDSGLECPSVVGDPALLLPRYFDEDVNKQHRIGLIPHFSHFGLVEFERLREQGAKIIDITGDVFDVVRSVKSCSVIASSSLHGLIIADAYGVSSKWLKVDGRPIEDDFKFHDYLASVGRKDDEAFVVDDNTILTDVENTAEDHHVEIDLDALYETCPFRPTNGAAGTGARRAEVHV